MQQGFDFFSRIAIRAFRGGAQFADLGAPPAWRRFFRDQHGKTDMRR
ncbi:hypothetical protein HC891_22935 [Candidatus Gracilibacteria bacterium]|nr:hypothetical protein [Candidatus Gracilibacteria bacterium]